MRRHRGWEPLGDDASLAPRARQAGTWRAVLAAMGVAVMGAGAAAVGTRYAGPRGIMFEGGPVESVTVVAWLLVVLTGAWFAARPVVRTGRLLFGWLSGVALMCAARELDLHELLNPEALGAWGVRYRIDWWLSATAPVLPRVLWFAIAVAALAGLAPSARRLMPLAGALLRHGRPAAVFLAAAVICLAVGFACDDILREVRLLPLPWQRGIEEVSEFLGAVYYLLAVVALRRALPALPHGPSSET